MAEIKEGYGGKYTEIRVSPSGTGNLELWIDQGGIPKYATNSKTGEVTFVSFGYETLAYMTINEAITLRDELNKAIKETAGV